jgi:hypothetical protein
METEAAAAIEQLNTAEKNKSAFRSDVSHLKDEKEDLEYQFERLLSMSGVIYKFTIGIIIVFVAAVLGLSMMYLFRQINIFLPLAVLSILAVFTIAALYGVRRRITRDIGLNLRKQKKAVSMINTKNAVYAYYSNFLDYSYKKFRVKNIEMLKKNLKDYENYKHLAKRFDALRNVMFQTEEEINRIMRENSLSSVKTSLNTFAKTFDINDKKIYYNQLVRHKAGMEKELTGLDTVQAEIWKKLEVLSQVETATDESGGGLLKQIVKAYMDHIESLVANAEKGNVEQAEERVDEETAGKYAV